MAAEMDSFFTAFSGRLQKPQLLSTGRSLSLVFKADDTVRKTTCIVKLYPSDQPGILREYEKYLLCLHKSLKLHSHTQLVLPYETGEVNGWFYQLFDYIPAAKTLQEEIEKGCLSVKISLDLLHEVAECLQHLHSHGVIHGDLKPQNILVTFDQEPKVRLIDFGMVQQCKADETIVVGTYEYMHPSFKSKIGQSPISSPRRLTMKGRVGTYIDIYALGVVAYQMLSRRRDLPRPLSQASLQQALQDGNTEIRVLSLPLIGQLANLLFQMLSVQGSFEGIDAATISLICNSLKSQFSEALPVPAPLNPMTRGQVIGTQGSSGVAAVTEALARLQSITCSLESATREMLLTAERIETPLKEGKDSDIIEEMDVVFANAEKRIRLSWQIAVGMACMAFLLITSMIVSTLVLTFVKGEQSWGLIFGGASIGTIVGVLLWRPYDRVFRALLLAQEIEMIHVQAISSFQATSDFEQRIEICREATEALQKLMLQHDLSEAARKNTKATFERKKKRRGVASDDVH